MQKAEYEEIEKKLEQYQNKDVQISFNGSLRTIFNIQSAKFMLSKTTLLIGNANYTQEIELTVDDIENVEVEKELILKMNGNYTIHITT